VRPRGFSRRLYPRRDEGGGGAKSAHAFRLSCATDLPTASDVRCWPHHFDLATLFSFPTQNADATGYVGAGLSPGDEYFHGTGPILVTFGGRLIVLSVKKHVRVPRPKPCLQWWRLEGATMAKRTELPGKISIEAF
jgi:hypothetical protein